MRCTFSQSERLKSKLIIDRLFAGGNGSFASFPLRTVYMKVERNTETVNVADDVPVSILISVPKKRFHHAVDRNRVKRQIREGWRSHQQVLREALPSDQQLLVALVWLSDQHLLTNEVENRVVSLIQRISEKL